MAVVIVPRKLWPLIAIFWPFAGAVEGQGRQSRSVTSKNRLLPACLKIQIRIFSHYYDNAKLAKIFFESFEDTSVPFLRLSERTFSRHDVQQSTLTSRPQRASAGELQQRSDRPAMSLRDPRGLRSDARHRSLTGWRLVVDRMRRDGAGDS